MKIYATSQAALSRFVGKDLWVFVSGGQYNQYESFIKILAEDEYTYTFNVACSRYSNVLSNEFYFDLDESLREIHTEQKYLLKPVVPIIAYSTEELFSKDQYEIDSILEGI